jgi:hypothetical protein
VQGVDKVGSERNGEAVTPPGEEDFMLQTIGDPESSVEVKPDRRTDAVRVCPRAKWIFDEIG